MSLERRFGAALLVLAAGNVVLAAGNAVAGEPWFLYGAELITAVGLGVLGGAYVIGRQETDVGPTGRRLMNYGTYAFAATGVGIGFVGVVLLLGL